MFTVVVVWVPCFSLLQQHPYPRTQTDTLFQPLQLCECHVQPVVVTALLLLVGALILDELSGFELLSVIART